MPKSERNPNAGVRSARETLALLRRYESRNVTFLDPDGTWPIVWERARGVHVWDVEGRKYLDLTAAFGVAAAGHANPQVVRAGQRQMAMLLHAMGDVHPHPLKAQLARELSRLTFERWRGTSPKSEVRSPKPGKTIFCNSGFEAVEAALKTARLATGKPGVLAFEGAYHGLGYGALNATHRTHFRGPFENQLRRFGHFLPFPVDAEVRKHDATRSGRRTWAPSRSDFELGELRSAATRLFHKHKIGAVLVEPVQARGGINIPPPGFLPLLRTLCDAHGALLIVDEIYTGFGRTGKWFACEHSGTVPDLICLGKAMAGGFPISACVGRADIMDVAWPASTGEAIHTSTFLGHPVGCAMALAQIAEIRRLDLVRRSESLGCLLVSLLNHLPPSTFHLPLRPRGLGLMAGLELRRPDGSPAMSETLEIIKRLLQRGFILLPEGEHSNVISFTPPLTVTRAQLDRTVDALRQELPAVLSP
ncbi:MAG: aspartate aminotransferase family protein, partial [Verrucomicrobia bacterium]|jgi:4-aminobutyrate aminotransferase-like enzyme|nr:aspartate aminotransferase family protein [Verrucomicrobiota bacterium]